MYVTYCLLVLGYTCVNIPYGTLCGALTQNIEERAQINTSRSVCAMVAINIINIITLPLIAAFGGENQAKGYLLVTVLYGAIFTVCHWFCFAKTKEIVAPAEKKSIPIGVQLKAAVQNRPYLIALVGQLLFGLVHYGRSANLMYYFKYVEGNEGLFTTRSWPSERGKRHERYHGDRRAADRLYAKREKRAGRSAVCGESRRRARQCAGNGGALGRKDRLHRQGWPGCLRGFSARRAGPERD